MLNLTFSEIREFVCYRQYAPNDLSLEALFEAVRDFARGSLALAMFILNSYGKFRSIL